MKPLHGARPRTSEVGALCGPWMGTECGDLQILFGLCSVEYTARTSYLMFEQVNFVIFCKY